MVATDLMLAHLAPIARGNPARGLEAVCEVLRPYAPVAIANLRSCEVVGLQSRMDDTLNLICAKTGSLPPPQIPKINVTLHRTGQAEIDAGTRQRIEARLDSEQELYAAAQELFHAQLSQLR
jgi:hypothetical protein